MQPEKNLEQVRKLGAGLRRDAENTWLIGSTRLSILCVTHSRSRIHILREKKRDCFAVTEQLTEQLTESDSLGV